jgi:hypothetical protein
MRICVTRLDCVRHFDHPAQKFGLVFQIIDDKPNSVAGQISRAAVLCSR